MKLCGIILTLSCIYIVSSETIYSNDVYEKVNENLMKYLKTSDKKTFIKNLEGFQLPKYFRDDFDQSKLGDIGCTLCQTALGAVIAERKLGASKEFITDEIVFLCTSLHIETEQVCRGTIYLNIDIFLYIIDNIKDIQASKFCGLIFQSTNCANETGDYQWTIATPAGNTIDKIEPSTDETFNILHLSDYHYDPLYTPGKILNCDKPLCCQEDDVDAKEGETKCSYWIEYESADTPLHLVEESLRQSNTHEFDYVYYTGDIISHRVWDTSIEKNSRDISKIYKSLKKSFGDKPVFPVLGNHESHPLNVWAAEGQTNVNLSNKWLYDLLAEEWSVWIPESKETISRGGYYTISPKPGFRIISLNSNICYTYNWWLVYEDFDPLGQLQWMMKVLLEAEKAGESAHILSHVPSGDKECLKAWSKVYNNAVQRFANTITGQFNGHTHFDEFIVYYNTSNPSQAINVAYNGASITTYVNNNPSYKLFKINEENFRIENYEEWTFNVTQANLKPDDPVPWYKLYSFAEAYGVKNLDATEIGDLIQKMTQDYTILDQYFQFKSRMADPSLTECNDTCKKDELCNIVTHISGDYNKCKEMKEKYDAAS